MPFTSLADLVRSFETGGSSDPYAALNYRYDPGHTASGAYQITDTLWRQFAPASGVNLNQYPSAYTAPASLQDRAFETIVSARGLTDWTCPGCNAPLTDYLNQHPETAGLPISGSSGSLARQISDPNNGSMFPLFPNGLDRPANPNLQRLNPANPSSWLGALGDWFASIAARAVLFVVALILLLGALYLFGAGEHDG